MMSKSTVQFLLSASVLAILTAFVVHSSHHEAASPGCSAGEASADVVEMREVPAVHLDAVPSTPLSTAACGGFADWEICVAHANEKICDDCEDLVAVMPPPRACVDCHAF